MRESGFGNAAKAEATNGDGHAIKNEAFQRLGGAGVNFFHLALPHSFLLFALSHEQELISCFGTIFQ